MLEPQEGMKVQEIIDWALYAENMGYGYIFRSDHLLDLDESEAKKVDSPECWVTLGAIAARTKRIRFGPLVSPVGFRNPALLGRMACTLDSFSGGRMCISTGAGWNETEYLAHGYEFPPFMVRRKQAEEGFRILRDITLGKRIDYDGEYYSAHVDCYPKPAKEKIHLIGGGRSPKIVATLAKYVDEWNIYNSPKETFQRLKQILLDNRSQSQPIEISQMGPFMIAETQKELDSKLKEFGVANGFVSEPSIVAKKMKEEGRLCGIIDEFIDQMNEKIEDGVQKFYFQILNPKDKEMVDILTSTLKKM